MLGTLELPGIHIYLLSAYFFRRPVSNMRHISSSLVVAVTYALTALGNIYGTSPVADTVWTAGRSETVKWMDDKTHPKLSKLGPVDVELYTGDDVSRNNQLREAE